MRSMCEQIKALKKDTAEPTWAKEILNSADTVKRPPVSASYSKPTRRPERRPKTALLIAGQHPRKPHRLSDQ